MKISVITESNVLSLWLGGIEDFGDLDEYIWGGFERDFGIEFEERTAPEIDAHDQPKPVIELLDGFSFCDQWISNAMTICQEAGWSEANCAVVLYNVRYPESLVGKSPASCPIKFVGNVEWDAE